ncbi:hypothetical protein U0C82_06355 [Fulvimarina sp. 2208YS6-2-32]|uniref:Uncharacterized protein n=1 Tax=Fulvimarina uroteuthidis TaxID=3098149 RepID=A0ABU5I060_9HYPH|nr:hypothetical protein [Fulvimarina sp. 2208YS6-2-32]MDY8108765.1 hypothetical protein [Fulvimarina sp. 2208YS6-2-32]
MTGTARFLIARRGTRKTGGIERFAVTAKRDGAGHEITLTGGLVRQGNGGGACLLCARRELS